MSASRLCCWKSGEDGVVVDVHGDNSLVHRLHDLGFVSGASVRVVQHGCPMLVQVGNSRVCLRREDAQAIDAQSFSSFHQDCKH